MSFSVLIEKIEKLRNPSVVGLDPDVSYIPGLIKEKHLGLHGDTLKAAAEAINEYCRGLIGALYDVVPAVKFQSAFFECAGYEGIRVLEELAVYAKETGMYVILDAKRGDIGSTVQAYASAYLGKRKLLSGNEIKTLPDCLTVNPYLGGDGIAPFVKECENNGKSIFVLAKTSNESSADIQDKIVGGKLLYIHVAELIEKWGANLINEYGYSDVGAVVGATYPEQLNEVRKTFKKMFLLVPGYGAQGGMAKDAAYAFDKGMKGAVVNSSRGIMCAYKKHGDENNYASYARKAALEMRDELTANIN